MKKPVFTGSAAALVTPFTDRGVDYDRLAAALDRQAEGGTAGRCRVRHDRRGRDAFGSGTRFHYRVHRGLHPFPYESHRRDRRERHGLAAANAARRAERLGADALLLTTPYYNKASSEGIVRHFAYVAEHSELPLIVYNVPGRTRRILYTGALRASGGDTAHQRRKGSLR